MKEADPLDSHRQFQRLARVQREVERLRREHARGEDVATEIATLFRTAKGRTETTDSIRGLIAAIGVVAKMPDEEWVGCMGGDETDLGTDGALAFFVGLFFYRHRLTNQDDVDVLKRLQSSPVEVAAAVRLCRRGRGRPKRGEPIGSKWAALADVIRVAGLGSLDEKAVEQLWKKYGFKMA